MSFENINTLENDVDVIAFYRATEDSENSGIEIPHDIIINAYTKRDEYYQNRYEGFAPNNLKFNIDKLLTYYEHIDNNRLSDLENAQIQCNFREFYSILNVEELYVLGY